MLNNRIQTTGKWKKRCAAWLLALTLILSFPSAVYAEDQSVTDDLFYEVRQLLQNYHLSGISESELLEAAISGMIDRIGDPYTIYMPPQEWDEYQDAIEQNYVGIGIRLGEDANGVYAVEVFPGSPAEEAGILGGDYIVAINGESTISKTTDEIISMMSGEENTTVVVTVSRSGGESTYTLTRRSIQIPTVEGKWIEDGYGYIKISSFSRDADKKFEELMIKMKGKYIKGLVIDVRDNPGGYLETVAYIAGEFIDNGPVLYARYNDGTENPVSIMNGFTVDFPVVILVNENSASGSEVLAGALKDYEAARVIGTQTYGKGSVQTLYTLSNGGVLKVTTQEYMTPLRNPVNGVGITPDIVVQGSVAQLLTGFREAGLTNLTVKTTVQGRVIINGVNFNDSLPYVTRDNRVYVHSRVLGALAGLNVEWDSQNGQVVLTKDNIRLAFDVKSPFVYREKGMTYIDLSSFAGQMNQFQWSYDNNQLTMSING